MDQYKKQALTPLIGRMVPVFPFDVFAESAQMSDPRFTQLSLSFVYPGDKALLV